MNIDKTALRPLLILLGGVSLAGALIASSGEAEKTAVERPPLLVTASAIEQSNMPIPVRGTGTVVAAQQVMLVPQVGGKIIETDARLMPGGRFSAGETLARIEPRDARRDGSSV